MTQNRQPAGVPTGGQFAPDSKGRSDVALDDDELEESCSECGASLEDNEGYDGQCGNCADIIEAMRHDHWGTGYSGATVSQEDAPSGLRYQIEKKLIGVPARFEYELSAMQVNPQRGVYERVGKSSTHDNVAAARREAVARELRYANGDESDLAPLFSRENPHQAQLEPWSSIHSDYKNVAADGTRTVLAFGPHGTTLVPWFGPEGDPR